MTSWLCALAAGTSSPGQRGGSLGILASPPVRPVAPTNGRASKSEHARHRGGLKASLACRRDCAGSSTAPSGFRERLAVVVLALHVDFPAEPRHEHRLPPWPLICRGCLAGLPGAAAWRGYNLELDPAAPQATRSLYWRPARHGSLALVITGDSRHMLNMSAVGTAAATFAQTLGRTRRRPRTPGSHTSIAARRQRG